MKRIQVRFMMIVLKYISVHMKEYKISGEAIALRDEMQVLLDNWEDRE